MKFTFDMEPYVTQAVRQVRLAIEHEARSILREAFDAGYELGADDEAQKARWVGPPAGRPPEFEEWLDGKFPEAGER